MNITRFADEVRALGKPGLGPRPSYEEITVHPEVWIRDGMVFVSAEDGRDWADYYGDYRGGYSYINPQLEALAKKHSGYWEWQNPGCIVFCEG